MGIKDKIKDIYYAGEEQWYRVWDKVDTKVPVYKVLDPVDKVVPSFALFLALALILVIIAGIILSGALATQNAIFIVNNPDGTFATGETVTVDLEDGRQLVGITNANGEVSFGGIPLDIEMNVDINGEKGEFSGTFFMKEEFYQIITLAVPFIFEPKERTIILQNALGVRVMDPVELVVYCENSGVVPQPASVITVNGVATIIEPLNCGRLYVRPVSDNYAPENYAIDSTNNPITLVDYEPPKNQAIIKIRDEDKLVTDTSFKVSLSGKNTYNETTNSASQTIIAVVPGTYFVSVTDPSGSYGIATSQIDTLNGDGEITVSVSKTIKATISVIVADGFSGAFIESAEVALKNSSGIEIARSVTGDNGAVSFSVLDTGDYIVTAKKVGDVGVGYFAKSIDLDNVITDVSTELGLELITTENAGRVQVRVIDQDNEPVHNAKIMLKYASNDSIVELNEQKNYVISDINGYSDILAGKVEGVIVAYATKYPFFGTSSPGTVDLDKLNEFTVEMEVGSTTVNLSVSDEDGEPLDATAEIFDKLGNSLTGLISVEQGEASRTIKAGRSVYAVINAEGFEPYVTAPTKLWPDSPTYFDVDLTIELDTPKIVLAGLFTESGRLSQGLNSGEKYYAKFKLSSDADYSDVQMHFRVGTATHITNDYLEIERVEAADITRESRGISYDPVLGYSYDSENFTTGDAKWVTVEWDNFGTKSREITVHFKVKPGTPPNEKLQFFWRGAFDSERRPDSTADDDFYADTYQSKIYYEGSDVDCETDFCLSSEWLYSEEEELYINKPYQLNQIAGYKYHFQIVNNSSFNYTAAQKPIYMYVEVIGNTNDDKMVRIQNYTISDNLGEVVGGQGYIVDKVELNSFERQTAVDVELDLEGIKDGGEIIRVRMQSEGVEIYSEDISFTVLAEDEFIVGFSPTRIAALINTELEVSVYDEDANPVGDVALRLYAKEPGYDDFEVDSTSTNRLGIGTLQTGAFLEGTKLYIEVEKIGFARATYSIAVSGTIVSFAPSTIVINMNTVSDRDITESVEITNLITHDLELFDITVDAAFEGLIKEGAFESYFEQFEGEQIGASDSVSFDMLRAQLSNEATATSLPNGYSVEGVLTLGLRPVGSNIIHNSELPVRINIASTTSMESVGCIDVKNSVQSDVTQTGKVTFNFELLNACQSDGVDIGIDSLTAMTSSQFDGQAEISIQSMTGSAAGRSALDSSERKVIEGSETVQGIQANERLAGTVTYVPSQSETGETITLNIEIDGLYGDQEVSTTSDLQFTVDVINLRECINIQSDSSPVSFDDKSIITIDATGCSGQDIDIQLCKDDARCAGGVEGGVTLSTKSFSLEGESKDIQAYSPSLPGTYGISVHAREDGTGSFTYIGEAVVGFEQAETKRFELNKTDFTLIGSGAQDSAILTNTLLVEDVTVKANNCIWGEESVEWDDGAALMGSLTGAMLGASIGSMVSKAFGATSQKSEDSKRNDQRDKTNTGSSTDPNTGIDRDMIITTNNDGTITHNFDTGIFDVTGGSYTSYPDAYTGTIEIGDQTKIVNTLSGESQSSININGISMTFEGTLITDNLLSNPESIVVSSNGITYAATPNGDNYILNQYTPPNFNPSGTGNIIIQTTPTSIIYRTPTLQSVEVINPIQQSGTTAPIDDLYKLPINELSAATNTIPKLYFGGKTVLLFTIAGAIIGNLAAQTDCHDNSSTADYTEFVTFLQGDSISVTNTATGLNELKTIPSDAGSLSIQMGNADGSVSAAWDYDNADYSTEENVGLVFTNSGMNEAEAKYGLLTIQATEHINGDYTHINSSNEYDVVCQNGNFANYWVGDETDEGLCSGISERTYSQQYHIRVTSGEPADASPYLRKSSSCYVGTLAGSTGRDAVPRIKLDWDWDSIEYDSCDYGNDNYIYCDATQFSIAMVKRLALLKNFLELNPGLECPPNRVIASIEDDLESLNSATELVVDGFIGVTSVDVLVNHSTEETAVTVNINNRTGASVETNMATSITGEASSDSEIITETFPAGESQYEYTINTPEWNGVYMATATMNGPSGNKRAITRAFINAPSDTACWANTTTASQSGLPAIYYYLDQTEDVDYGGDIGSMSEFLDIVTFRSYLMKDNFSDDFKSDFKRYYEETVFQQGTDDERVIMENFESFDIYKKFTNDTELTAGLYYVALEVDMDEDLQMFEEDDNTEVDVELLLVKNPTNPTPFYSIPFDGELGFDNGRESYGTSYENEDTEITLNDNTIVDIMTSPDILQNGLVKLTTQQSDDLSSLTSYLTTRGQLLSVSAHGSIATMDFTPNYATPIMARLGGNSGTDMLFAYQIEEKGQPRNTGGNLTYWTGAAQSYDFYGAFAAQTYYDSADFQLDESSGISEPGVTYGFSWDDITNDSTLYLKTIIYAPTTSKVVMKADNSEVQFWTPNKSFATSTELTGISGMAYNDYSRADGIETVQEILDLVRDGQVCVTNDGGSMNFWWNPRIVSITAGSTGLSLEGAEINLIGN